MSDLATTERDPLVHHHAGEHLHGAFGNDAFGVLAERIARFFGTATYIGIQSALVVVWIIFNGFELLVHFDPYPFILLNLVFSTQAAYAAPLILLAQTRQADRDKLRELADAKHREAIAVEHARQLSSTLDEIRTNTTETIAIKELSEQVRALTREIHDRVCAPPPTAGTSPS